MIANDWVADDLPTSIWSLVFQKLVDAKHPEHSELWISDLSDLISVGSSIMLAA